MVWIAAVVLITWQTPMQLLGNRVTDGLRCSVFPSEPSCAKGAGLKPGRYRFKDISLETIIAARYIAVRKEGKLNIAGTVTSSPATNATLTLKMQNC